MTESQTQSKVINKSIVINRKKNLHKKISKIKEETQKDTSENLSNHQDNENDKSISEEPSADDMDDYNYKPSNIKSNSNNRRSRSKGKRPLRKLNPNPKVINQKITMQFKDKDNTDMNDANSQHSEDEEKKKKSAQYKNVRSVDVNRQTYDASFMDTKNLQNMDDMELFAVIDSNFIKNINLLTQFIDFPKIIYEDSKIIINWTSEIFGFNINIIRPYTDDDFMISK